YYILTMYHNIVTGNSDKMIETYQLWIQNYPRDSVALLNLGVEYLFMGQFEKELEYMRRSHEVDPGTIYSWVHLIQGYTALNRFDEARETGRQAIAHGFDASPIHGALMRLAVAQNDAAAYNQESDWLSHHSIQAGRVQEVFIQHTAALGQ